MPSLDMCLVIHLVRGGHLRAVRDSGLKEEALFDEVTDPYEMTNLAAATEARTVLARMREHMRAWMDSVGDVHARPPTT